MNTRIIAATLVALAAMGLAGCTSAAAPKADTQSPTPTVESATPEQVASVLAKYSSDWQEVIDKAGHCRAVWTLGGDELEGMSCYLQEQTIGNTAQLVMRGWDELKIPDSMVSLVDETKQTLQQIADTDITAACGDASVPNNTDECNAAIGSRYQQYTELGDQISAWQPYL